MRNGTPLRELFGVRSRYRRAVNVLADYHEAAALSGYIVTPLARSALGRIVQGLRPNSSSRSWSITGPYGAGKSAFALFAARVLGTPPDPAAREALRRADPALHQELLDQIRGFSQGGFFVVPTVGGREPLPLAVLRGLISALGASAQRTPALLGLAEEARRLCHLAEQGEALSPSTVTGLIERVARGVREADQRTLGLLLLIDELGKLLEYAALEPRRSDVFLLQAVSELADRSDDPAIGLMVILHQDFSRYADRLGPVQRSEWRKVQGRFADIAFLESQDEFLRLLGAALVTNDPLNGLAEILASEADRAAELGIAWRDPDGAPLVADLARCAPLHPTVALVLGKLFRSHLAQNERSLFAFLSSGEPYSLQDFLRRESWGGGRSKLFYRIDQLYDYARTAMGSALYGQSHGKRWAEIESALDRLPPDASPLDARLVKAIGLFALLGDQQSVKASSALLAYSLADGDSVTTEDVESALERLQKLGIVVYRRHRGAYGLWEGSDIDLDEQFRLGLERLDRSASMASLLRLHGHLSPYVAKRHLHETGTLRYFAPWVVDVTELPDVANRPLAPADGAIVFVVAEQGGQTSDLIAGVERLAAELPPPRRDLLFFAVPRDLAGLHEALEEVCAWDWVARNTPGLEGDSTARKELAARQLDAQGRLSRLCARIFDKASSYSSCQWFWRGEEKAFSTARELSSALSEACDRAYALCPIVHNELVNRRTLSSSAAAARRNLIERMLESPNQHRFGIDSGFPPEISIYLSVLERTGVHHAVGERWELGPSAGHDPCRVAPLWEALDRFLATTELKKRPVSELFALLREPPYGIRDGVLPIFLAAAVVHWEREVALFEVGTFLPRVDIAAFERLMKAPDQFHLQRFELRGTRRYMLEAYSRLLAENSLTEGPPTLLTAVRPLLGAARRLPPYSRATRAVSPQAVAVREALFTAREPHRLLFEALPGALGVDPCRVSEDELVAEDYFRRLREAIEQLQAAYGRLLADLRSQILQALRLPQEGGREEMRRRASYLEVYVADLKLRAFLHRVGDLTLPEDRWVESVAALLAGKPPAHWNDLDVSRFKLGLAEMAGQLRRIEEVALESGAPAPDGQAGRVLRLSVLDGAGGERSDLLRILPAEEEGVRAVVEEMDELLQSRGVPSELRLAVVAELAGRLMSGNAVTTGDSGQ